MLLLIMSLNVHGFIDGCTILAQNSSTGCFLVPNNSNSKVAVSSIVVVVVVMVVIMC